jgi:hypothetical protein
MQYLRARYYNTALGTFNRLDPFSGNLQDPQSLHKYLYVHGDPIQGIDPTGLSPNVSASTLAAIGIAGILAHMAVPLVRWMYLTYTRAGIVADIAGLPDFTVQEKQTALATLQTLNTRLSASADPSVSPEPDPATASARAKIEKLIELWSQDPPRIEVKRGDFSSAGVHLAFLSGTLFVEDKAFEHGNFAVALTVFAEFQHDENAPDHFPSDGPEVQAEFGIVREAVPPGETNEFIDNLGHGFSSEPSIWSWPWRIFGIWPQ